MSQVSKFWTKTTATVESVEMHVSKRGSSRKSKTTYEVYVKYAYIIGNKKYRGSNVGFGYDQNNTEDHSAIFNSLKYAKKISIYVNPFDLEESVITTGLNNSVIGVFIFSVMWNSMIGMMILQLVYKDGPKQENEIFNKAN